MCMKKFDAENFFTSVNLFIFQYEEVWCLKKNIFLQTDRIFQLSYFLTTATSE